MFKNYLTIAFRSFWNKKVFTCINVIGLAIGVSASLVIYLIVIFEFSFDKFQPGKDRIYRLVTNYTSGGKVYHNPGVASAIPGAVTSEVSGLETIAPIRTRTDGLKVTIPSDPSPIVFKKQTNFLFADKQFFKLLPYKWLAGSPDYSFRHPDEVVLTRSIATLYFPLLPTADLPGKIIVINDSVRMTVTGIVEDIKENSDFYFKAFISRSTLESPAFKSNDGDRWGSINHESQLWIRLNKGTVPAQIADLVNRLFRRNYRPLADDHSVFSFELQPLSDLHFNTDYSNFDQHQGHKPTLYGLLAIAAFLLLLGCINFINLTTAAASTRAKEIGVRKTMGSSDSLLIFQFLSETTLLVLISFILSLILAPILLIFFSDFIPQGIHLSTLFKPGSSLFMALLLMVVALISGLYPALVLSSYKPIQVLKNNLLNNGGSRTAWLRKSLTIFQFIIAQVFIIATLLVGRQIHYSLNKDLGFKKDAILYFHTPYNSEDRNKFLLMDKLRSIPQIGMISLSNNPPSALRNNSRTLKYKDGNKVIESSVQVKFGDTNYLKLYQMKLVAGNPLPASDTLNGLLINETYAHILGFQTPDEVVGKILEWRNQPERIVGVVADLIVSYQPGLPGGTHPLRCFLNFSLTAMSGRD